MSSFSTTNHLIAKRIKTSFSKTKDFESKKKKLKQRKQQHTQDPLNFNMSMDVKNYMIKERSNITKHKPNHTINFDQQNHQEKRRHSLFFTYAKKEAEGASLGNVKLVYGGTPVSNSLKQSANNYSSQKSIKQKRKRLSLTTGIKQDQSFTQNSGLATPIQTKKNKTVNIQKHMIITKYQKIKQLLKGQKYAQASMYLKQIIPHIQDSQKKKQLYFWFIAALIKSNLYSSRLQVVENYIVECLQEFPNFYQIYLYWAKIKSAFQQKQQAVQIYQKAISLNNKNSEAYIQLANIYLKDNEYKQAYRVLKQGFLRAVCSSSICFKLIQNYKIFNLSLSRDLSPFIDRIQQNSGKNSTQYLYALGFLQKQKQNQNQAMIYFFQSLKYNSNKGIATKSLQNILKIHISKKDFYAACYDLKRSKHLNIQFQKIQKYQIFLEGVNFVMKKKNQEGIKLLKKILNYTNEGLKDKSGDNLNSKMKINSFFVKNNSFEDDTINFNIDTEIISLTVKYLAYAFFKLGNHKESIKCYKMLVNNHQELDTVSKYNLSLAEGVVLADSNQDFNGSMQKFQEAKTYLNKVQPWIYQSMVKIQQKINKKIFNSTKGPQFHMNLDQEKNQTVIQALNLMEQGQNVNESSSNLLYHRTILHLYFSSFKTAMEDINLCIEKAEQNLPKYFYLRGICYACMKNLKKAINQFSISISLGKQYSAAYLQRAKCHFLQGQTQMGFQDLKVYMQQQPEDYHVHKWIGDLLFQGTSYNDSIKAYNQMGSKITLETLCMRMKAQIRVCSLKKITQTINEIKSNENFKQQNFRLDISAFNLLCSLMGSSSQDKQSEPQIIQKRLKILDQLIQKDSQKGHVFNLVDCMNLIGMANFYLDNYSQAYESFLLVLQFFKTTVNQKQQNSSLQKSEREENASSIRQKDQLNTQSQEQVLDLREQDIYYNIFLSFLASKQFQTAKRMAEQEMIDLISNKTQLKVVQNIIKFINQNGQNSQNLRKTSSNSKNQSTISKNLSKLKTKKDSLIYLLQPRIETALNFNLKKQQITINLSKNCLKLKTSPIWTSYHDSSQNLSFGNMAKKLVHQLHAGYIDNMPQGPWIRRNKFGVLFTDNILDEGNESSFITTHRPQKQQNENLEHSQNENSQYEQDYQDEQKSGKGSKFKKEQNIEQRKRQFLKQMKLDFKIEKKLNNILKKPDN